VGHGRLVVGVDEHLAAVVHLDADLLELEPGGRAAPARGKEQSLGRDLVAGRELGHDAALLVARDARVAHAETQIDAELDHRLAQTIGDLEVEER
jgi:hypothetical protein